MLDSRKLLALRIIAIASAILVTGTSVFVIGAAILLGSIPTSGLDTLLHIALAVSCLSLASYLYFERTENELPEDNQTLEIDWTSSSDNDI